MLFEMSMWVLFTGVIAAVWFTAGMAYADSHPAAITEPRLLLPPEPERVVTTADDLLVFSNTTWPEHMRVGDRARMMPPLPEGVRMGDVEAWIRAYVRTSADVAFSVRGIEKMKDPPSWYKDRATVRAVKHWLVKVRWLSIANKNADPQVTDSGSLAFYNISNGAWVLDTAYRRTTTPLPGGV